MQSMGMVNVCKGCYMNEHGSARCHSWPVWIMSRIRLRSKTGKSCQGGWVFIVLSPAREFFALVFRHFADPFNIDKRKWEVCTYLYELLCYSQWCEILQLLPVWQLMNYVSTVVITGRAEFRPLSTSPSQNQNETKTLAFFLFKLFSQFAKSYSSHYSR